MTHRTGNPTSPGERSYPRRLSYRLSNSIVWESQKFILIQKNNSSNRVSNRIFNFNFWIQIYVIENGQALFIWIGPTVNATEISDIWGVNSSMEILDGPVPEKNSDLNSTVRTLITSISQNRGRQLKQYIIRVGHPDAKVLEAKLRRLLVSQNYFYN